MSSMPEYNQPRFSVDDFQKARRNKQPKNVPKSEEQDIENFMSEVVVLLHTVKEEELVAVYDRLKPPMDLQNTFFYQLDTGIEVTLGVYGNHKAALIRTNKGRDSQHEIERALKSLTGLRLIISVGYAYGRRDKCKLGDVLVSTAIDGVSNLQINASGEIKIGVGNVRFTPLSIQAKSTFTNRNWIDFICTKDGKRQSAVHCGVIISCPMLVKNKDTCKKLMAGHEEIIGGEMEGQELAQLTYHKDSQHHNIDFIVIKGVADFGDGKNQEHWQFTASLAAATYAEKRLEDTENRVYFLRHGKVMEQTRKQEHLQSTASLAAATYAEKKLKGTQKLVYCLPHGSRKSTTRLFCVLGFLAFTTLILLLANYLTCTSPSAIDVYDTQVFGRERELESLTEALINDSFYTILITGQPGIGKSAIVRNATVSLSQQNLCVVYVDCLEVEDYCVGDASLFKAVVEKQDGLDFDKYPCISRFRNILQSYKPHSKMTVQLWQQYLNTRSVLILDNYNASFKPSSLTKLRVGGYLSVVVVSRYEIPDPHYSLQITGLQTKDCITLVDSKNLSMSISSARDLCKALDGIPLAILLTTSYLSHTATLSVADILLQLKSSEYNQAFNTYASTIDNPEDNIPGSLVRALCMVYDALSPECQQCAFNLTELSVAFNWEEAKIFYNDVINSVSVGNCINKLIQYSLLQNHAGQYKFLTFIKRFIHWYKPVIFEGRNPKSFAKFWGNIYTYYAEVLQQQLTQGHNILTAVKIGLNQQLVNSLLPLLEAFRLRELFESALNLISWFCSSSDIDCFGDKYVYACSRLTKAVHCPMMQADAVILRDSSGSESSQLDQCRIQLEKCMPANRRPGRTLFTVFTEVNDNTKDEIAMVEARGYHNLLLMSTKKNSVPWYLSLVDLSAFLTSITYSYAPQSYTKSHSTSTPLNFVNGLKYFVLGDTHESEHYLESVMDNLRHDYECQSILKLIVAATLYADCNRNLCSHLAVYLHGVQLNYLKFDCYLGVMNDVILPFLNEVQNIFSLSDLDVLNDKFYKMLSRKNAHCGKKIGSSHFDCFPLNRYGGIQSRRLLRTHAVVVEKILSTYSPNDSVWLCSILKDKTTSCNGDWPPLSVQYKTDYNELYRKYLVSLRWFMDDKEFARWNQSFHSLLHLNLYPYFD